MVSPKMTKKTLRRALRRSLRKSIHQYAIEQDDIQRVIKIRKPYTVAEVRILFGESYIYGVGFSKMNPIDTWNEEEGKRRATNRAILDAVDQVVIYGYKRLSSIGMLTKYLNGEVAIIDIKKELEIPVLECDCVATQQEMSI